MIPLQEKYVGYMRNNGYKCTPQRLEILSYFLKQRNKLISAKRLSKHLQRTSGKISMSTVYRNLALFSDMGLMDFTYSEGEYLYYLKSPEKSHQHLFICNNCLSIKEISICPMDVFDLPLDGWTIHHHRFEVYGVCPACL